MTSLTNADLAPVAPECRTWKTHNFAALWVGMAVCIPTYQLAAGLLGQGMSWSQAMLTIALGNLLVLVPMVLNGHPGTKYGIPFPVLARASFGVRGAHIPSILRALVACGWFGIQCWIGGHAIYQLAVAVVPGTWTLPQPFAQALGISSGELLGFLAFWFVNLHFIHHGTESIKRLQTWAAPFLILMGLALLAWAWMRVGSLGEILEATATRPGAPPFSTLFWPGLTAMVGFWATLALNIPDFTRYGSGQRSQILGQVLGLPTTMILFSFVGIAVTSATRILFGGEGIWDPVELVGRIGGPLVTLVAMLALSIVTLSTNVAANVVSPANGFSNLSPQSISFRAGGYITAIIGLVMMPWKLIESSEGYIFTWLIGYSALLGPVLGILLVDYFLLRRTHLDVDDLYRRGGAYEYSRGFNPAAIAALVLGVAPNLPGFLAQAFPDARFPGMDTALWVRCEGLYVYAWFIGFFVAGGVYRVLMAGTGARTGPGYAEGHG